jgi:hypothetical protein
MRACVANIVTIRQPQEAKHRTGLNERLFRPVE